MELKDVLPALGFESSEAVLKIEWEASQRTMPSGPLSFLAPPYVAQACRDACLPEDVAQAAVATAERIEANPPLRALAWHCHHCVYRVDAYEGADMRNWPAPAGALGEHAGMFYLLVLLSGLPEMQRIYRERAIPQEIFRDTLDQLKQTILKTPSKGFPREPGDLAVTASNVWWQRNHFRGVLYTLGRLQFQFGSFHKMYKLRAFRHRTSGAVVAMSDGGVRYRADGDLAGAANVDDGPGVWASELAEDDREIAGNPIAPDGRAVPKRIVLPKADWRQALATGDPVLNIHIPGGSPMGHGACGESVREALRFFPRYFPDKPFVAFCCNSWLLNGQIEDLLPPESNIVRFQREFYLFPIGMNGHVLLNAVFQGVPQDFAEAPRKTAFQRAIADHVLRGGKLIPRGGGCFLLREDADWGSEVYRRRKALW